MKYYILLRITPIFSNKKNFVKKGTGKILKQEQNVSKQTNK